MIKNMTRIQTFENFIVDGLNLAKEFALEIATLETKMYNPFCVYGRSGSGKTHLLRAIQNHNRGKNNSMYITCKELMNKYVYICKLDDVEKELNQRFEKIDIILIDNVEFLSKSQLAQKVFTLIYNHMLNNHKQIVVAVKGDIKILPHHIYEKILFGLYIETQQTTYEQRLKVLKNEIKYCNEYIDEDVLKYIAINIYTDIGSMIKCLKKIIKICKTMKTFPDIGICKNNLRYDIMSQLRREIVPEYVIKIVADCFNISVECLMINHECQYERSIAIYMCWKLFDLRLYELMEIFGNRTEKEIVDGILGIEKLYLYYNGDTIGVINAVNHGIRLREGMENMDRWDFLMYRRDERYENVKKEGPVYKGIFWIKDIENVHTSIVSVKIEVNENGLVTYNSDMNSKKGNNYNHKITWGKFKKEITEGKPYNYYPRGRVEIKNGKAMIYAHPDICTQEVMIMIINEFNLHKENNIDKVVMKPDYSKHYNCYLDEE